MKNPGRNHSKELDLLDMGRRPQQEAVILIKSSGEAEKLSKAEGMHPHPSPACQSRLPHFHISAA